jgi:hypothetical protein
MHFDRNEELVDHQLSGTKGAGTRHAELWPGLSEGDPMFPSAWRASNILRLRDINITIITILSLKR